MSRTANSDIATVKRKTARLRRVNILLTRLCSTTKQAAGMSALPG